MIGLHHIYQGKPIKASKKKRNNESRPAIYPDVVEVLRKGPKKRTELLQMGFVWTSLDKTIQLLGKEQRLSRVYLTNKKGHRTGVIYRLVRKGDT